MSPRGIPGLAFPASSLFFSDSSNSEASRSRYIGQGNSATNNGLPSFLAVAYILRAAQRVTTIVAVVKNVFVTGLLPLTSRFTLIVGSFAPGGLYDLFYSTPLDLTVDIPPAPFSGSVFSKYNIPFPLFLRRGDLVGFIINVSSTPNPNFFHSAFIF